jgi:uncharacterized protein
MANWTSGELANGKLASGKLCRQCNTDFAKQDCSLATVHGSHSCILRLAVDEKNSMANLWIQLLLIGLVAGIAGGMFGIGGGAIMVPAMVLIMGLEQKFATGTSIAAQIFPIGILGAVIYYRNGQMNIKYAALIALGLVIGNLLGAQFANQSFISNETMKKLYGLFLFAIGFRYLFYR